MYANSRQEHDMQFYATPQDSAGFPSVRIEDETATCGGGEVWRHELVVGGGSGNLNRGWYGQALEREVQIATNYVNNVEIR